MTFVFAGELISYTLPLPIPAGIWGLVLLLVALWTGIVKLRHIEDVANWFLVIIPVLFVVPAVGILEVFGAISWAAPAMIGVVIATYFAAFASTGWISEFMIWLKGGKKK